MLTIFSVEERADFASDCTVQLQRSAATPGLTGASTVISILLTAAFVLVRSTSFYASLAERDSTLALGNTTADQGIHDHAINSASQRAHKRSLCYIP